MIKIFEENIILIFIIVSLVGFIVSKKGSKRLKISIMRILAIIE